ncbi:hypothetical protein PISL3812_01375 [Talaromyces islandicus]|uniref:DNA-binding protein RAP1 n=1 Tax=Talaromyces islandicus TaxID=28573 RepID=A0A0U1LLY9_TALIS|nr:hypothetical protein PISL3812_01375 [Talaromyces islandicus]
MAANVVYTKPNPDGRTGTLFGGKRFWLSLNVPQRDRFKEVIKLNGGIVVLQEKDADIKLVDHRKREIPLDTYSYKYVEKSILNGRLEDLEAHRAGKRERPVGAHNIPSRTRRTAYTLEDDQILWDWLHPYEKRGDQVSGNLIYQELAKQHPRHTFQSYRDRYLKHVRGKPRPGGPPREDQQQRTAAEGESAPVPESQRGDSQPLPAVQSAQSNPIPRTPEPSVQRNASSHVPNQPSPAEAGPSETTELVRQPARSDLKAIKRKRLSNEEFPPAVLKFGTDSNPAKRRRHATESDPSTPGQFNDVSTTQTQNDQARPPESIQSQSKSTSQLEEEENFAAINELPALGPEDDEDDENTDEDGDGGGVEAWMEEHIRNGKRGEHVIMALDCTSMNAELADRVLVLLSAGHGIPNDMPGVWTKEEDEIVLGSETRKIQSLLQKHGSDFYNERFKYLEERQKAHDIVMRE